MTISIQNIFNAESRDIQSLYNPTPGLGFFIPTYQRQYTWSKSNIERMMNDIISCIERLKEFEDSVTFIGTVITVANNDGVAVQQHLKNELPTKVHHVIDGQQRLTSYSIILMAYYSILEQVNTQYKSTIAPEISTLLKRWVNSKVSDIQKIIKNSISIEMGDDGDVEAGFNFYPKITRAYEDSWSKFKDDARYASPIASFTHDFIQYYITKTADEFNLSNFSAELQTNIVSNYKYLKENILELIENDELIPSSEISKDPEILERFLNVKVDLPDNIAKEEITSCNKIIRTIMLGNFILKRVVATFVEVSDDNYAFDMFEALNTTGEPLTAFETFKPKVVEHCQKIYNKEYQQTKESEILSVSEKLLSRYKKAEEKHKKTTALFQAFRIAYDGKSLSGHLSEQRRYINDAFEKTNDKLEFLNLLSSTCEFITEIWDSPQPDILKTINCNSTSTMRELISHPQLEKANFCIKALKSANHKIVCGLFASFYNKFKSAEFSYEKLDEYIDIIISTTSFFIRYRAFSHSTDGIDSRYREIMSSSADSNSVAIRTSSQIKSEFNNKLNTHNRNCKETWLHAVKSQDLYKNRKDLSKLMLLLSFEKSVHDNTNPGHLCNGTSTISSYLNLNFWAEFISVEHVWPQNADDSWSSTLDSERHLNSLGNLSMLPTKENTIAGNKPWQIKRSIYTILSESNESNRDNLIKTAVSEKVITSNQGNILKQESKLHPHIVAIAMCPEWDANYVDERSINLLTRVWDITSDWLN